ncbi:MAG: hypothetical protein JWQ27_3305 [Ferruginibacter sp.]|nr:hypothetical protein [Ferruginibacter sp.]
MDLDIAQHLPEDFAENSRVWIYQSDRLFLISEAYQLEDMLNEFVAGWNSHGTPVKGFANLFFGRFIVFMVDETASGISGCSTDSSVRVIKEIEKKFGVDMFNRQLLAFIVKDKVEQIPLSQAGYALQNNLVNGNTAFFDNTALTKKQLQEQWIRPLKESWLGRKLALTDN